jgi:hypothetical protein
MHEIAYLTRMHRYTMTILVGKITSCFQTLIREGKVVAVFSMGGKGEHLGRQAQKTDTACQLKEVGLNSLTHLFCSFHYVHQLRLCE